MKAFWNTLVMVALKNWHFKSRSLKFKSYYWVFITSGFEWKYNIVRRKHCNVFLDKSHQAMSKYGLTFTFLEKEEKGLSAVPFLPLGHEHR